MSQTDTDIRHMRHALAIGGRNLGQVWPNPAVGCVIVKDDRIVGRGWTGFDGAPHGEVNALEMAGADAKDATAYVTLEPCSHTGKTPPCADALIAAEIGRVVIAMLDPNPQVNGQGAARLRAAGIKVTVGVEETAARAGHRGFLSRIQNGRPAITLKLASSLDGRIATQSGESMWITGPKARRYVHVMRANHDAVMVGGGTARADDPLLGIRDLGIDYRPVRVIWSRHLDLPLAGKLAASARDTPLWIIHGDDAPADLLPVWQGLGARLFSCPVRNGRIDAAPAMQALGGAGLTRVFCEGGGQLAASLLGAGLVDQLVHFTAGIGIGSEGLPMLGGLGLEKLGDAPGFKLMSTCVIGKDTVTRWQTAAPSVPISLSEIP